MTPVIQNRCPALSCPALSPTANPAPPCASPWYSTTTGCFRPIRRPARSRARLYAAVRGLPIISPHGHTDPAWFATNAPFAECRPSCCWRPITTCTGCSTARASPLDALGVPSRAGPSAADPREAWRLFAEHFHLFRGTPSAVLARTTCSSKVFGFDAALDARNRRPLFRRASTRRWRRPAFRPRALFERFNIEVHRHHRIADRHAGAPRGDPRQRLEGPRGHRLSPGPGDRSRARAVRRRAEALRRAHRRGRAIAGTAISPRIASAARSSPRIGATSTDHGHPTAATADLSPGRGRGAVPRVRPAGSAPPTPNCSARRC